MAAQDPAAQRSSMGTTPGSRPPAGRSTGPRWPTSPSTVYSVCTARLLLLANARRRPPAGPPPPAPCVCPPHSGRACPPAKFGDWRRSGLTRSCSASPPLPCSRWAPRGGLQPRRGGRRRHRRGDGGAARLACVPRRWAGRGAARRASGGLPATPVLAATAASFTVPGSDAGCHRGWTRVAADRSSQTFTLTCNVPPPRPAVGRGWRQIAVFRRAHLQCAATPATLAKDLTSGLRDLHRVGGVLAVVEHAGHGGGPPVSP